MAKKYIRIIQDIEEAISREVRRIVFFEARDRGSAGTSFKEMFDPFTGELKRKPIEPRFYDDAADSLVSTSPRFTLRLLKLYEDLNTKRLLPPYGEEYACPLPSPGAYAAILSGADAKTTDGGTGSTVEITHRKIREVQPGHAIRLLCSDGNDGTYPIESITLNGNGPHTLHLNHDLISSLPVLKYNKDAGMITFEDYLDLDAVKVGDIIEDINGGTFAITAVNVDNSTLAVAPGSAIVTGAGAKITRTGDVLQYDDAGQDIKYVIIDPSQPVSGKATKYRRSSQLIPYTFLYYIKIVSRERDDHIAVAERMMQVFNPPRGVVCVTARSELSTESEFIKDSAEGDSVVFLKDASRFYTGETIRIFNDLHMGEEVVVDSVNTTSNSITLKTPLSKAYTVNSCAKAVSNYDFCQFERDFTNHVTEDKEDEQLWIHRFTFRIEGWVESRIDPCEAGTDETTYRDEGDVNFIEYVLEDMDGNELEDPLIP